MWSCWRALVRAEGVSSRPSLLLRKREMARMDIMLNVFRRYKYMANHWFKTRSVDEVAVCFFFLFLKERLVQRSGLQTDAKSRIQMKKKGKRALFSETLIAAGEFSTSYYA